MHLDHMNMTPAIFSALIAQFSSWLTRRDVDPPLKLETCIELRRYRERERFPGPIPEWLVYETESPEVRAVAAEWGIQIPAWEDAAPEDEPAPVTAKPSAFERLARAVRRG
jgi:hypothetical protein